MAVAGQEAAGAHRLTVERLLVYVVALAIGWNLIGNLLLPGVLYVPANLAVAAGLIALARRAGLSWEALGWSRSHVKRGVFVGLIAAATIVAVLLAGLLIDATHVMLEDDAVRQDSTFERWFIPLVRIPLGTALFEEVLFRSVLLAALSTRFFTRVGVVVSSVTFGLWHIVPAWESADGTALAVGGVVVGTVLLTTLTGVVLAGLRLASRSVIAPIIAHGAANSFAYAGALLAIEVF